MTMITNSSSVPAWPEFAQTLPTTEFIAYVIWQRLADALPLTSVRLYEDPELWAEYRGEAMQAYLTVATHFSAAHRLALDHLSFEENSAIYGLCARPHGHGHNYGLEITVKGSIDPHTGMIVDLAALQRLIEEQVVKPLGGSSRVDLQACKLGTGRRFTTS
jgi:6-pyruvoyl-tetrahydropterin synthase